MADADRQVVQRQGLQTVADGAEAARMADSLVQGAITSLRRPVTVPKAPSMDLSSLEDSVSAAIDQNEAAQESIDTGRKDYRAANEGQQSAIRAEGKASADRIMADQARAEEVANTERYFASMFGITKDSDAEIARVAKTLAENRPIAEEKLRKVQKMQSVGPLDNPLSWIVNQLQLPAAVDDYNREADVINGLQDSIDGAIKTAQDAATFANRGIPTITVRQANASAAIQLHLSEKNAQVAAENLAKQDVAFAVQKLSGDLAVANMTGDLTRQQMEVEKLKYQGMINEINLADTHAKRMLEAARLLETLEKTKGLDIILAQYDLTMGHPKGTTTRYTFEKFSEPQRQNIIANGSGSLGADPFMGMLNWFMSRPGPNAAPETVKLMNWLRDKSEVIGQDPLVQRTDEKQKPMVISQKLKEQLLQEIAGSAGKPGTLFYELEPATMIASNALPATSKLAIALEPLTKQTGPIPTATILATIREAYPNPNEFGAVVSEYYQKNVSLRNGSMNTSLIGVKLPTNYTIAIPPVGGLFIKPKFDLTKPEEATKYALYKDTEKLLRVAATAAGAFTGLGGAIATEKALSLAPEQKTRKQTP